MAHFVQTSLQHKSKQLFKGPACCCTILPAQSCCGQALTSTDRNCCVCAVPRGDGDVFRCARHFLCTWPSCTALSANKDLVWSLLHLSTHHVCLEELMSFVRHAVWTNSISALFQSQPALQSSLAAGLLHQSCGFSGGLLLTAASVPHSDGWH